MLATDEITLEGISLDDTIPCEGEAHGFGVGGHIVTDPAEYRITTPCCGAALNQCRGRVGRLLAETHIKCGACPATFPSHTLGVRKL